jgi:VIT1/CCC1 family predicted Fe2+/Mn2+ transporter
MRAMDSRVIENLAAEGDRRRLLTPLFIERARSVVEVPVRHDPAKDGSHYSLFALAEVAADFCMLTAKQPFLIAGLVAGAAGAGALLLLVAALAADSVPLALAALMIFVGAALALLVAAVGSYVQRTYEIVRGGSFFRVREKE